MNRWPLLFLVLSLALGVIAFGLPAARHIVVDDLLFIAAIVCFLGASIRWAVRRLYASDEIDAK